MMQVVRSPSGFARPYRTNLARVGADTAQPSVCAGPGSAWHPTAARTLVERDASGSGGGRRDDRPWSAHRPGHGRGRGVRLAAAATDVAAGTIRHWPSAAWAGAP